MSMAVKNIDLKKGVVRYPITKTKAFEMPLSDFQVQLLERRIEQNAEEFGADCPWVFPSVTSESGHLEKEKVDRERTEAVRAALVAAHVAPLPAGKKFLYDTIFIVPPRLWKIKRTSSPSTSLALAQHHPAVL